MQSGAYPIDKVVQVDVSRITFVVYFIHPVVKISSSGQELLFEIFDTIH